MKTLIACLAMHSLVAAAASAQPLPLSAPAMPATTAETPRASALETKVAFCDIDALLTPVDDIAPPASESSLCQPAYSIDTLSRFFPAGSMALDFSALGNDLVTYYEFRALALSNPSQCGALVPLQAEAEKAAKMSLTVNSNWESNCLTHFNEMRFVRALVTHAPDAGSVCQEWASADPGGARPEAAESCRKMTSAADIVAASRDVCKGSPAKTRQCVDFFRAVAGDASVCARSTEAPTHKELCRGYAAFAKAGPAKNPELCGDNPICLAMAGSAARVSVHAQRGIAEDMSPVLFKEAQEKLRALAASSDPLDAAIAKEIDAREERIAQLRLKLDPHSRLPAKALKSAVKRPARRRGGASDGSQE